MSEVGKKAPEKPGNSVAALMVNKLFSLVIQNQELPFVKTLLAQFEALSRDQKASIRAKGLVGDKGVTYASTPLRYIFEEAGLYETFSLAVANFLAEFPDASGIEFNSVENRNKDGLTLSFTLRRPGSGAKETAIMEEASGIFEVNVTVREGKAGAEIVKKRSRSTAQLHGQASSLPGRAGITGRQVRTVMKKVLGAEDDPSVANKGLRDPENG